MTTGLSTKFGRKKRVGRRIFGRFLFKTIRWLITEFWAWPVGRPKQPKEFGDHRNRLRFRISPFITAMLFPAVVGKLFLPQKDYLSFQDFLFCAKFICAQNIDCQNCSGEKSKGHFWKINLNFGVIEQNSLKSKLRSIRASKGLMCKWPLDRLTEYAVKVTKGFHLRHLRAKIMFKNIKLLLLYEARTILTRSCDMASLGP